MNHYKSNNCIKIHLVLPMVLFVTPSYYSLYKMKGNKFYLNYYSKRMKTFEKFIDKLRTTLVNKYQYMKLPI